MGNQAGFKKSQLKGQGSFTPPSSKLLDRDCVPGEIVHWNTISGKKFVGELKEWDSNVAVINIGNGIKSIEC